MRTAPVTVLRQKIYISCSVIIPAFFLGLVAPRVPVLSFSIVALFAPIRGFSFCFTITALCQLSYEALHNANGASDSHASKNLYML